MNQKRKFFAGLILAICIVFGLGSTSYNYESINIYSDKSNLSESNGTQYPLKVEVVVEEFQINNYTDNYQYYPKACALNEEIFVVVWESWLQEGFDSGIYFSVFNATTGENITAEIRVNYNTTLPNTNPSICALTNESFAIAWERWDSLSNIFNIYTRVFNATTGMNITKEIKVNEDWTTYLINPSVCALSFNNFAVAWQSFDQDGNNYGIFTKIFNATTGENTTSVFQVNAYSYGGQEDPAMCALSEERFVVAWQSENIDGDGYAIMVNIFNATNGLNLTKEIQVNYYWDDDQEKPTLCKLTEDSFIIAWDSNGQDGNESGVFATIINAATFTNTTAEFQINYYTTGHQTSPSMCMLSEDIIAFTYTNPDDSEMGVSARLFNITTKLNITEEFRVNNETYDTQTLPIICALTNDTFVIVWESYKQDGSDWGVYGSVFSVSKPFTPSDQRLNFLFLLPTETERIIGYDLLVIMSIFGITMLLLVWKRKDHKT